MVFEIIRVLNDSVYPIEALTFFEKWLILTFKCSGNTGLLVYENEESNVCIKNFRRKNVLKISVVRQLSLLISLNSEGIISIHLFQFPNVSEVFTLSALKNISLFHIDSYSVENDAFRLGIYCKNRFYFLQWSSNTFSCVLSKTTDHFNGINVSDNVQAFIWCKNLVYFGSKKEYFWLDMHSRQSKKFCQIQDRNVEPFLIRLDEDVVGVQVDFRTLIFKCGVPYCERNTIEWSSVPLSLCYCKPFILGLLPNVVEIRFLFTDTLIQVIDIRPLQVKSSQCFLKSCLHNAFLYSPSSVWKLNLKELRLLVDELVENKEYQTAVCLVDCVCSDNEEKVKLIENVRSNEAKHYFGNGRYHKAMEIFCDIDADPFMVIGLFPDIMPERYVGCADYSDETVLPSPESAIRELIIFLIEKRRRMMSAKNKFSNQEEYKNEILALTDTSLLKCYLKVNDALVSPLLRLENQCILEESEKLLKEHNKLSQLVTLYEQRKLHLKALEVLKSEAVKNDSPLFGYDSILKYLKSLGNEFLNILLEYAPLVFEMCGEDDFLSLFTADLSSVESLDRSKIFDFIQSFYPHLLFKYLCHVVHIWNDPSPLFHNQLILAYLNALQNNEMSESLRSDLRRELKDFLDSSKHYDSEYILPYFDDIFLEEKVTLLRNLNQETEALKLYLQDLRNFDSCLIYCSKSDNPVALYEKFLALLLEKNTPEYTNAAIKLLDLHGMDMNYVKALQLLPNSLKICDVKNFLINALRKSAEIKRKNQLTKNMRNAELVKLKEEKILYEQTKFCVSEDRICKVCKRRLSNSALVRYPGGVIIHFGCCKDFSAIPKN